MRRPQMRRSIAITVVLGLCVVVPNASCFQVHHTRSADEITLERTSGYGAGYQYSVKVRKDGAVTWLGGSGVRVTGKARSRIPQEAAAKLFDSADAIDFFSAKEVPFEHCVTDGPEVTITLVEGGNQRQISSYCNGMKGLGEFADAIDAEVHTIQWIFVDVPTLHRLISAGSLNMSKLGAEYMEEAIEWDLGDVIHVLAKHGANVNSVGPNTETFLMTAVLTNKYSAAKALLDAGANPAARDQRIQETPAINAGYRGAMMVKLFLDKHVSLDDTDRLGTTMLMAAASHGHIDAVRLIMEAGANVNARNNRGQTAIGVAEEYRERGGSQTTSDQIIGYLSQHGGVH